MLFLLSIFTAIYIVFILFIISGLFRHNVLPISNLDTLPYVSVVIAARNEENNLPGLIDDLINQEYPLGKFEIIIINDRSYDSTQNILIEASENYSFIKHIKIDKESKHMTPKKNAINRGINEAKGELILATDADCRVGPLWIASMAYSLINKNGIIIGYSEIDDKKGTVFEKYQKIDFLAILVANAGAAGWKHYWSGTGQNLAYYKSDFLEINGFEPVKKKISGDDMYLVQSISKIKTGSINIDPNSFVKTEPLKKVKDFLNQRTRWSSNAKLNVKGSPYFFSFLVNSLLINIIIFFSFLFSSNWYLVFFIKFIFDGLVIFLGSKLFNLNVSLAPYLAWAFLQPFYIPFIAFMGLREKFTWKQ